jgi:hypothetical protein
VTILDLPAGEHELDSTKLTVRHAGGNPRHFVSRGTGHPLVAGFETNDFRFWHDEKTGYVRPLLHRTFMADGWEAILATGDQDDTGQWFVKNQWGPALAAAQRAVGAGCVRICQIDLAGRTRGNPVARIFARRLLENTRP